MHHVSNIMLLCSVAAKHKETKQFFAMYNTLEDTKVYLEKEVSMLLANMSLIRPTSVKFVMHL